MAQIEVMSSVLTSWFCREELGHKPKFQIASMSILSRSIESSVIGPH